MLSYKSRQFIFLTLSFSKHISELAFLGCTGTHQTPIEGERLKYINEKKYIECLIAVCMVFYSSSC